jgi:hypothetical protein
VARRAHQRVEQQPHASTHSLERGLRGWGCGGGGVGEPCGVHTGAHVQHGWRIWRLHQQHGGACTHALLGPIQGQRRRSNPNPNWCPPMGCSTRAASACPAPLSVRRGEAHAGRPLRTTHRPIRLADDTACVRHIRLVYPRKVARSPLQGRRLLFKKEGRNYSAFRARWGAKLRASVSPAR